jgi:large subunit ribosomal protein L18
MRRRRKFVPYRRKLEGKTDYKKRLALLKSDQPRLVVRKTLKNVTAQLVTFDGKTDKTLFTVSSKHLKEHGWKVYGRNTPSAYLVGYLFGMKAKRQKVDSAILDMGLYRTRKGNLIFSVLKGVIDAGLIVPHSEVIFPGEGRVNGSHISENVTKEFEATKIKIQQVK